MFDGVAFLLDGHLTVSASRQGDLLLRVDPAETDALVTEPHARRTVMRGRPMDGWLRVDAWALGDDERRRALLTPTTDRKPGTELIHRTVVYNCDTADLDMCRCMLPTRTPSKRG